MIALFTRVSGEPGPGHRGTRVKRVDKDGNLLPKPTEEPAVVDVIYSDLE